MTFNTPEILPLNDEIRAATQGKSRYYSNNFILLSDEYHQNGYLWESKKLEKFFQEGLLQYYIGKFTGVNLSRFDYYLAHPNIFIDSIKEQNLVGVDIPCDKRDVIEILFTLLNRIKAIPLLSKKGGYFQRLKQLNEQYVKDIRKNNLEHNSSLNDRLGDKMQQNDREIENLQFEIYNWVNHSCAEIRYFLQTYDFNLEEIKNNLPEFKLNTDLFPDREELSQVAEYNAPYQNIPDSSAVLPTIYPVSEKKDLRGSSSTFFSIKSTNNYEDSTSTTSEQTL
ncbi:MAG: hypothetical protein Q8M03_05045 [Legionella sp.]|nr:hypothetical protein [Legionella sp.]